MKSKYQEAKDKARNLVISVAWCLQEQNASYGEYALYASEFERLAKRYGLVREFRENGIL